MEPRDKDSDSTAQRNAEKEVLLKIKDHFRLDFDSWSESLEGVVFQVDAVSSDKKIFCEIYSGINELKSGQKRKLVTDALKLITIEKLLQLKESETAINKYLVVLDEKIENTLSSSKSWLTLSLKFFGIKILKIDVSDETLNSITIAKEKQYR